MSKRHSSFIFVMSLAITSIILLQMGLYATSMVAGCDMKFNLISVCHSWLKTIGLSSMKYILDGLVFFTLSFSLWKIGAQWFQMSKMKRRLQQYKESKLSKEFNEQYGNEKDEIVVLSHPVPMAFTVGFIQPKIIITTGLIHFLDREELNAVMAHEMYHKENRDPLKVFILSLSSSIMWYLPIQKWFHEHYKVITEVLADEFAIRQQGTTVNLGSALLKMLKLGQHEKMPFTYVSFSATSVNYRIAYILNPVNGGESKFPKLSYKNLTISILIFCFICSLFIYTLA